MMRPARYSHPKHRLARSQTRLILSSCGYPCAADLQRGRLWDLRRPERACAREGSQMGTKLSSLGSFGGRTLLRKRPGRRVRQSPAAVIELAKAPLWPLVAVTCSLGEALISRGHQGRHCCVGLMGGLPGEGGTSRRIHSAAAVNLHYPADRVKLWSISVQCQRGFNSASFFDQ